MDAQEEDVRRWFVCRIYVGSKLISRFFFYSCTTTGRAKILIILVINVQLVIWIAIMKCCAVCTTTGSREWRFHGEDDNFIQVGYAMIEECVQPLSTVADSTYIHTVVCEVM